MNVSPPLLVFSPTTLSKRTPQKNKRIFLLYVPAEHLAGSKHCRSIPACRRYAIFIFGRSVVQPVPIGTVKKLIMVCYPQCTPMGCRLPEQLPVLRLMVYSVSQIQHLISFTERSDLDTDRIAAAGNRIKINVLYPYYRSPLKNV